MTAKHQLTVRLSLFLTAVSVVFLLIGGAAEAESPPRGTIEYVVQPGDTLWAIATGYSDPGVDLRDVVSEIKNVNGLRSSEIHPGQILAIPLG